jgi:hypothetical protein
MFQSRNDSTHPPVPPHAVERDFFADPSLEERVERLERRFGLLVDLVVRLEDRISRFFPAPRKTA